MDKQEMSPEVAAIATQFLTDMLECLTKKPDTCMRCHNPLTTVKKIGRSLYALPCGCRLYQGNLPSWARTETGSNESVRRGRRR